MSGAERRAQRHGKLDRLQTRAEIIAPADRGRAVRQCRANDIAAASRPGLWQSLLSAIAQATEVSVERPD